MNRKGKAKLPSQTVHEKPIVASLLLVEVKLEMFKVLHAHWLWKGAPKLCLTSHLGHPIREARMGAPGLLSYLRVTQDTALRTSYSKSH